MAAIAAAHAALMISVAEADRYIAHAISPGPTETVPTLQAGGRVLRKPVRAERPFPPFDRVMMDGFGVSHNAWNNGLRTFRVAGMAPAGAPQMSLPDSKSAVEVMTGAIAPVGVSLIIPIEQIRRDGDYMTVAPDFSPPPGGFIHAAGSDAAAGAELLMPGIRNDSRALAVAISCGAVEVAVSAPPRIAIVSTGDELVELDSQIEPHQIRRSNAPALCEALRQRGYGNTSFHHFPDHRQQLLDGMEAVIATHDVVVLSGGVSKGQYDHVPETLERLNAAIVFHRVAQRPGKPMLFAKRDETLIFGLPGNPVSTLIGLYRHVLPALDRWTGALPRPLETVALSEPTSFPPPLTWFLPVTREGIGTVAPRPVANSGDFAALLQSDGFIELPADITQFPAGYVAPFYRW